MGGPVVLQVVLQVVGQQQVVAPKDPDPDLDLVQEHVSARHSCTSLLKGRECLKRGPPVGRLLIIAALKLGDAKSPGKPPPEKIDTPPSPAPYSQRLKTNSTMNSINNTTSNSTTTNGWQLWMNRKARRAAERGARNRTLTRLIREEQAAWTKKGPSRY